MPLVPIVIGTDHHFAELNRQRISRHQDQLLCFPMNPQVHGFDNLTIRENLESLSYLGSSIQEFFGCRVVVSPITLSSRFNAKGVDQATNQESVAPKVRDARQSKGFGAAWTVGVLAKLAAGLVFESLTFGDAFGPDGVINISGNSYPVSEVLAAIQSCSCIHEVTSSDPLNIAALGMTHHDGTRSVLLANMSERSQTVSFETTHATGVQANLHPESIRIVK